jgi:hypothetical protein
VRHCLFFLNMNWSSLNNKINNLLWFHCWPLKISQTGCRFDQWVFAEFFFIAQSLRDFPEHANTVQTPQTPPASKCIMNCAFYIDSLSECCINRLLLGNSQSLTRNSFFFNHGRLLRLTLLGLFTAKTGALKERKTS